jgi:2-phosphoglycerate kinase
MIYLLGGPPRVGKSIIAGEIRRRFAVSVVSTDALGAVLESVLSPEAAPDLFAFGGMPMAQRAVADPAQLVEGLIRENRVVWKAVEAFARREHDEGRDVLIEGVAVLPELMSRLAQVPYRVVFIGNQGEHVQENIRSSAARNVHDWMRGVSNPDIAAFAGFVRRMSARIEQEAEEFGFEYIELDQKPFEAATEAVIKALGLSAG